MNADNIIRVIIESMPNVEKSWMDSLSSLLTPVIALIAIYIAFQQHKINKIRLRHELYERRLKVYKTVQVYLSEIARDGDVPFQRSSEFYGDASEATFLFEDSIQDYIEKIYSKAIDLHVLHEKLYPSGGSPGLTKGEERSNVAQEQGELLKWMFKQLAESKELFKKYLGVK